MRICRFLILLSVVLSACSLPALPTTTPDNTPASTSHGAETPSPAPSPSYTPQPVAVVMAATVNVRAEPNGEVVGQIYAGQSVTVEGCADGWCEISDPVAGYVFQGCLSLESELGCQAK